MRKPNEKAVMYSKHKEIPLPNFCHKSHFGRLKRITICNKKGSINQDKTNPNFVSIRRHRHIVVQMFPFGLEKGKWFVISIHAYIYIYIWIDSQKPITSSTTSTYLAITQFQRLSFQKFSTEKKQYQITLAYVQGDQLKHTLPSLKKKSKSPQHPSTKKKKKNWKKHR